MSPKPITAERFLLDVAKHTFTVLLDNGIYRHLHFRKPNSWDMWFEIITWPDCLAIHGDMGTWTFARVEDMFTFFRSDKLKINASYWGEKIQSESRFGGPSQKFHPDIFKASALSHLDDHELSEADFKAAIIGELEERVFCEEHESEAKAALADFKYKGFAFSDSWEISGHGYTYHFLWCLHAIVWAIQQYDAAKAKRPD